MRTAYGKSLYHRFIGKVRLQPQRAAMKWFLYVSIDLSAAFRWWTCGRRGKLKLRHFFFEVVDECCGALIVQFWSFGQRP